MPNYHLQYYYGKGFRNYHVDSLKSLTDIQFSVYSYLFFNKSKIAKNEKIISFLQS